jgi:dihydrofolate reductase
MGRKTFASLGRPLPSRTNVVVTRSADFEAEGVRVAHSLEEAVAMFPAEEEIFIIGGGDVYRQAMPLADKLYLTKVNAIYDGDTFFPQWREADWEIVSSEYHERGENYPHPFEFRVYVRK